MLFQRGPEGSEDFADSEGFSALDIDLAAALVANASGELGREIIKIDYCIFGVGG